MPKLRPQATKFVKVIVDDIKRTGTYNGTQAALQSYNTDDPAVAGQIAYENLRKPEIKQTIDQALAKAGLTLDVISNELKDLATVPVEKVSADVKLRSLETLLKLHNAFPGSKHTNLNLSVKGKMKDLSFQDAKLELEKLNSQIGEVVEDHTEPE